MLTELTRTYEYYSTAVLYLDVIIKINIGIISTSLYKKNTDNHRYLHYTSCHPMHMKNSIIFSQLLRYKRISSDRKDYITHSKEIVTHFLHIGYPIMFVLKQWYKVSKVQRASQFTHREKTLTITFHWYKHITLQLLLQINQSSNSGNSTAISTQRNIYFVIHQCAPIDNRLTLSACW